MDISLDETEKLISLSLGVISLLGVVLRKWFAPRARTVWNTFLYWFSVPKRLRAVENVISGKVMKGVEKELPLLHSEIYIIKHKCNFLLNDHTLPLYECNLAGDCIWSNEALQDVFGMNNHEISGDGWLSALHPQDIIPTSKKWQACVSDWVPYKARYRVINQKTHQISYCETSAIPICDEKGNKVSYLGKINLLDKESYD